MTRTALILEDIGETRRWLASLLAEAFPDCLISEAATMRQALSETVSRNFDLALIDLGLPDGSGLEIVRSLRLNQKECLCVITTVMSDDASIVGALCAGAQGYLLKDQPPDLLVRQLRQMAEGVPALSPSVARRIMDHFRMTGPSPADEALTAREKEVLSLIGRGLRNSEVARSLRITEHTVAGYIKDIYRKLGISSRAEASWHASRLGLRPGSGGI